MEWTPKWVKLPIIDFVRKVYEFRERPEDGWNWVLDFANALMLGTADAQNELAHTILAEANEYFSKKSEAGRLGGIASANARGIARPPRSTPDASEVRGLPKPEHVYDFARENGLDEADARDWYEMTIVDRGGLDRNGKPIVNWKGACKRFCTARAKARNKEGENQ